MLFHLDAGQWTDSACVVLATTVLLGAGLAIPYMRGPAAAPLHWSVALAHGALGAASLALLLVGLRRGLAQTGMGTAGFGVTAAVLLGLALLLGLTIAASGRRRRPASGLVGVHASLAISAFVLLCTLLALR